jgi:hypothetical protein
MQSASIDLTDSNDFPFFDGTCPQHLRIFEEPTVTKKRRTVSGAPFEMI